MRRTLVWTVVAALLVGLAACGDDEPAPAVSGPAPTTAAAVKPAPGQHALTLDHGDATRRFRLHAPAGYDGSKPVPLVIALHPYPGDGLTMSEMVGLDALAEREGFLTAYPDGVNGGFNAFVCCGQEDDVGFLAALAAHLVRGWNVDADRVYLTGISNGGDLSFRAAVEATGVFAAIGVVSGGFIGALPAGADYAPKSPVSVITFIGDQDRYAGEFAEGLVSWRKRLRCAEVKPAPKRPAANVTLSRGRCADGSDIDVYTIGGMGHSWPGATAGAMAARDAGVVATDLIWRFFAAHPRKG
ncbi:alpha/beta hydrolase family esterase [Phytohabitans houttuyneae]|uniref:alpha/beta hydrolase family esterase n=1 Tax=Phytohabitans houttuyneae TaxID=1076126 RepID=UPI001FE65330|nr:PHB depolymerase family esterase [Phytohabitans houttuyneae]